MPNRYLIMAALLSLVPKAARPFLPESSREQPVRPPLSAARFIRAYSARSPRYLSGMARGLKVFRTAIGFHDAYVAAPTQKAALEAWGTTHDLFARKQAEIVTDDALTKEPLARPGEVIKRLRGSEEEQIAALPAARKKASSEPAARNRPVAPKPDRTALEKAEAAIEAAEERHARESRKLADEEMKLKRRKEALERSQATEIAKLKASCETARRAYDRALRSWNA